MSQRCEITGAEPRAGNNVSHAKNHTRRRWVPNIKKKRIFMVDQNKWVTVKLTAKALKTVTKQGLTI
jgi:large subunit ribosomal protein L28